MLKFLKLGGSLITDKNIEYTARVDTLRRIAEEIKTARELEPSLRLVLGHGSGSFGHVAAKKYGTRHGVKNAEEWKGFLEVWREARRLDQIVLDIFLDAGLPVIAFPPSGGITAEDQKIQSWDLEPLQMALAAGLVPLVYGDVIFDRKRGGIILSTEELFDYLARVMKPEEILLAGMEEGVWKDFPVCSTLIQQITPASFPEVKHSLGGSAAVDVTGGMLSKVQYVLGLVQVLPGARALIFSGDTTGNILRSLRGEIPGTLVQKDG